MALFTQEVNPYFTQANQYYSKLTDLLNNQSPYNPETDPTFQSYKSQYEQGAQQASNKAMADMNRRGILDSTITGDRLARIQQEANKGVQSLIPGLAANHHNQRQQEISNAFNLFNSLLGAGQGEQLRQDQNRQFDIATSGQYIPQGAQEIIDDIIQQKRNYAAGGTQEELKGYADRAIELRRQLSGMGIDAERLFGPDIGIDDAYANIRKAFVPTAQSQQNMLSTILGLSGQYGAIPQGTGQTVGNMPLFSQLGNYLGGLEGQPTMAAQQFDLSKEKFNFDITSEANRNAIQWANHNLSKIKAQQDEDYRNYLKDEKITEQQGRRATEGYISQILNESSREDAMSYIVENAQSIIQDGAHIQSILNAIDAKFPRPRHEDEAVDNSLSGLLNP